MTLHSSPGERHHKGGGRLLSRRVSSKVTAWREQPAEAFACLLTERPGLAISFNPVLPNRAG